MFDQVFPAACSGLELNCSSFIAISQLTTHPLHWVEDHTRSPHHPKRAHARGPRFDCRQSLRLYLATRHPNPHYLPETCVKVNLVNFAVTRKVRGAINNSHPTMCWLHNHPTPCVLRPASFSTPTLTPPISSPLHPTPHQGLEDQLLAELLQRDRPELEEARDRLVVAIAADKRQLQVGGGLGAVKQHRRCK